MNASVEKTIDELLKRPQHDDQPRVQSLGPLVGWDLSWESHVDYKDVVVSLSEDSKAIKELELLLAEASQMVAMLYSRRSLSKAFPKVAAPDGTRAAREEAFMLLQQDLSRLHALQRWQAQACARLAQDIANFSKESSPPSLTHMWLVLRILDKLFLLDHVKDSKPSLLLDFFWHKTAEYDVGLATDATPREVARDLELEYFLTEKWAVMKQLAQQMVQLTRVEDIVVRHLSFCLDLLEGVHTLLAADRAALLRTLAPLLLLAAAHNDKATDIIFKKKITLERALKPLRREPVVAAFAEMFILPGTLLTEASPYFKKMGKEYSSLMPSLEALASSDVARMYALVPHVAGLGRAHDEFCLRFTALTNQLLLLRDAPQEQAQQSAKHLRAEIVGATLEGFRLLGRVGTQLSQHWAWKAAHPAALSGSSAHGPHDPVLGAPDQAPAGASNYECAVRYNMSWLEKRAVLELISCMRGVGALLAQAEASLAAPIRAAVDADVVEFVRSTLGRMLTRLAAQKKRRDDISIILSLKAVATDWMGQSDPAHSAAAPEVAGSDSLPSPPSAPSSFAQLHCMQHLVRLLLECDLGGRSGLFNSDRELWAADIRELEAFLHRLLIYPQLLNYRGTLLQATDLGFLWFRESYLESHASVQFSIECSAPWLLLDLALEDKDDVNPLGDLLVLPLSLYNDAGGFALGTLKSQFLFNEIEAELDLCFDQLVFKLSKRLFAYFKCRAASMLDNSSVHVAARRAGRQGRALGVPRKYEALLQQQHLLLLGRNVNLRALVGQHLNKLFHKNAEFLVARFEAQDLCSIIELQQLLEVLHRTHRQLAPMCPLDPFAAILAEASGATSLVSFASRIAVHVAREVQHDIIPNFKWVEATRQFERFQVAAAGGAARISPPSETPSFLFGSRDLNEAFLGGMRSKPGTMGLPHVHALVAVLGAHALPLVLQRCLDLITSQVTAELVPAVNELLIHVPARINLPPFFAGIAGSVEYMRLQVEDLGAQWQFPLLLGALRHLGALLALFSLLEIALRDAETTRFIQAAPFLGVVPGKNGQLEQMVVEPDYNLSSPHLTATEPPLTPTEAPLAPFVDLLQRAASASQETRPALLGVLQAAQVAEAIYRSGIQSESLLAQAIAHLSLSIDPLRTSWANKEHGSSFLNLFTAAQLILCMEAIPEEVDQSDALALGGWAVLFLLGQSQSYELTDFLSHLLLVAEHEGVWIPFPVGGGTSPDVAWQDGGTPTAVAQVHYALLARAERMKWQNNHALSMLRAHRPDSELAATFAKLGVADNLPAGASGKLQHAGRDA